MSAHAKLSPSSSSRWLNCPGSVAACEGVVDESSEFADEGTFAHFIAEQAIRLVYAPGAHTSGALKSLLGTVSECGRFTADAVMLEHLEEYVQFCAETIEAAGPGNAWAEVRVKAIHKKVWGTADFVAVVGDTLHVADLKYGAGVPVSPVDNTQARCYALGALERVRSTDTKAFEKLRRVRGHIFQPRNRAGGGVEELTRVELEAWRDEVLIPGVAATEAEDAPRCAGDWCKFCPVKGTCYALKDAALEGAKAVFFNSADLEVKDEPHDPRDLTVEQVGKALAAVPVIESWIKGLHAYAYDLANAGTAIDGYKLVRKTGYRQWRDEASAEDMLRRMLPDGASTRAEPKLLSPPQAEKLLDVLGKAMVAELTTKPDAGLSLVPQSDRRQAFRPGDVFTIEK